MTSRRTTLCIRPQPRTLTAVAAMMTALCLSVVSPVCAALPDYRLGDVATEDVVTPVPLLVINPNATEALKQEVAQQVPVIVRRVAPVAGEAEAELRSSVAAARTNFLAALQRALAGRAPVATDIDTPVYAEVVREVAHDAPKSLPFTRLAPLWVRGVSDDAVVDTMLRALREVMAQPVVDDKLERPLPVNEPVRLVQVNNQSESQSMQEIENTGAIISAGKVIALSRARRMLENYFPAGDEPLGRDAAAFVRVNAYPAFGLTEIMRARRIDGLTMNDRYEAAQVIVKKGQIIDRRALSAIAAMREKSMIGTLQSKLEQEKTVSGEISHQTRWLVIGLGFLGGGLVVIFIRLRHRPSTALVAVSTPTYQPPPTEAEQAQFRRSGADENWRRRALEAEEKVQRAHDAIRAGALGWMKEKIFRTMTTQRAELLSAQQRAESEMRELELRLEQLQMPLKERIYAYEERIAKLENDLAVKGEENRELIGARITLVKEQLSRARTFWD